MIKTEKSVNGVKKSYLILISFVK